MEKQHFKLKRNPLFRYLKLLHREQQYNLRLNR
jgi:hypothetical protein